MTALFRDAGEILGALKDLAERLEAADVTADIRIMGGAALALAYFDRGATHDIDGALHPVGPIKDEAAALATSRGWQADWINDKVLGFISHHDEERDWSVVLTHGRVTVSVASPQLLLAMKLLAGRGARDGYDIDALLGVCGVSNTEEVEAIFDRYYPQDEIRPNAWTRVVAWVQEHRPGADEAGHPTV